MNKRGQGTFDSFILWMVEQDESLPIFLCSKHLSKVTEVLYDRLFCDYTGWFKAPSCDAPRCCKETEYVFFPQVRAYDRKD